MLVGDVRRHAAGAEDRGRRRCHGSRDTLNERDAELRGLLTNANKATTVLAERSDQVVSLIADTNALLAELESQSAALDQISGNISALSHAAAGLHRREP